jgi:rubrerythrin
LRATSSLVLLFRITRQTHARYLLGLLHFEGEYYMHKDNYVDLDAVEKADADKQAAEAAKAAAAAAAAAAEEGLEGDQDNAAEEGPEGDQGDHDDRDDGGGEEEEKKVDGSDEGNSDVARQLHVLAKIKAQLLEKMSKVMDNPKASVAWALTLRRPVGGFLVAGQASVWLCVCASTATKGDLPMMRWRCAN